MSFTGDLGTTLGGLAAAGVPSGDSSLTRMFFSDLGDTVRFFGSLGLGTPDSFLDSLRAIIIYSTEYSFVIGGD